MNKSYTDYQGAGKAGATCCQRGCPLETDVSRYVALVSNGRFNEAMAAIREVNPFPGVCGRVCDHECERQCRRAESDSPVAIKAIKRFLSDRERSLAKSHKPSKKAEPSKGERVAIIGAGPAGLTAAADLARKGLKPTVFEVLPKPGGMMRYGIPEYRLPQNVLDHDIKLIESLGVEILCGKSFGADFSLKDLKREGFKAVLLAPGAQAGRKLNVPGVDLPQVVSGISLLRSVKLGEKVKAGARSVVIGGGDVAMDVARTALRLGAKSVKLVCLEGRDKMPAHDWELKEALDERIEFLCGWGPSSFAYRDETLVASFSACMSIFDASGKFAPSFDPLRIVEMEADAVYLAIGQSPALKLEKGDGVATTPSGFIKADPATLRTEAPWVFAAGDAAEGLSTVVKAIASGHKAAASIAEFLEGRRPTGVWKTAAELKERVERCETPFDWELRPKAEEPELPAGKRTASFDEIRAGLPEAKAVAEAERCLRCDHETKSYTYSRSGRERINKLARDLAGNEKEAMAFLQLKAIENLKRGGAPKMASFDDLIFLPANLTRLVIDPYREKCATDSTIGERAAKPLKLKIPLLLDLRFAEGLKDGGKAFALAAEKAGLALCGTAKPCEAPSILSIPAGSPLDESLKKAAALELCFEKAPGEEELKAALEGLRKAAPEIPAGVRLSAGFAEEGAVAAAKAGADFATVDASGSTPGEPLRDEAERIEMLPAAVEALRAAGLEESIDLLYFGGISGGADLARALSLGAKAAILGEAARIAAGPDASAEETATRIARLAKASEMETAILARCCGKTKILNLEPEDMRSLTVETSQRTGIPVVGLDASYGKPRKAS